MILANEGPLQFLKNHPTLNGAWKLRRKNAHKYLSYICSSAKITTISGPPLCQAKQN